MAASDHRRPDCAWTPGLRASAQDASPLATPTPGASCLRKVAIVGNHLPRQCGIATFTTDLHEALTDERSDLESFVFAMNDPGRSYAYPESVRLEIPMTDVAAYRRAADYLNVGAVDLVSLQHEYGIFGGKAGAHVLALLRDLRMPIVTTLHTVLAEPSSEQRAVMDAITRLSERLIAMSRHGAALLREVHGVPDEKIDVIPHGIPSLPDSRASKKRLGLEGKRVILTFGLLSPDKGIEHVINALPAVLEHHPDTTYVVLGVTHPHVKERQGETYRLMLERRARDLGVDSKVIFHDRFVSQSELTEFLAAADMYITPYLNPEQITSGTLAYALGSGKAVISTPYLYARELLAEGRGLLVPWPRDDPHGIERALLDVATDDAVRATLCARAAVEGRRMLWPAVAREYVGCFERAAADRSTRRDGARRTWTLAGHPVGLPEIDLRHLRTMTDDTGMLQHAAFCVPRYGDGYCLDDNARALRLVTLLEEARVGDLEALRALGTRYLAFMNHALDVESGRFRNFMSYSRSWHDGPGSEDSHGRALWALGAVVARHDEPGMRSLAASLFRAALLPAAIFESPRAWAYVLLGIDHYLRAFSGDDDASAARTRLADRLVASYHHASSATWQWFEDRATYCNARMSQALLVSGEQMGRHDVTEIGLKSLEWLSHVQWSPYGNGTFAPIGSNGFFERNGSKAAFDQQPVEACAMVSACLDAERITGDSRWAERARRAFEWFLGRNQLEIPLYDPRTGGCRDGLHPDRPNENQGAESTLSFLAALVEIRTAALTASIDPNEQTLARTEATQEPPAWRYDTRLHRPRKGQRGRNDEPEIDATTGEVVNLAPGRTGESG